MKFFTVFILLLIIHGFVGQGTSETTPDSLVTTSNAFTIITSNSPSSLATNITSVSTPSPPTTSTMGSTSTSGSTTSTTTNNAIVIESKLFLLSIICMLFSSILIN